MRARPEIIVARFKATGSNQSQFESNSMKFIEIDPRNRPYTIISFDPYFTACTQDALDV